MYDLLVIGGGINGAGIARDAAARGLSVVMIEKDDLAQATSSASTKLIHGGLRYLEQYDFKLVAESLRERERLLKSAPHIIRPLKFILPHAPYLRPKWLIRTGLFLYDHLSKRNILPASTGFSLKQHIYGEPLKSNYQYGFSYYDCWVDDARLVLACAQDARKYGADIRTRTECLSLHVNNDSTVWQAQIRDHLRDTSQSIEAKCVVNAAGPWVRRILDANNLSRPSTLNIRHSKGSHIVVNKIYDGHHAYLLQQSDGRIVFTIPYEQHYTLIGTTDAETDDDLDNISISNEEIDYLCAAVSDFFDTNLTADMIVDSYSGVRGLLDSGDDSLANVTRDYKLDLDTNNGPPLLNVFGGKLTTFRILSQHAVDLIAQHFGQSKNRWSENAVLPGGELDESDFDEFLRKKTDKYPNIDPDLILRYARSYGSNMDKILNTPSGLGEHFGHNIYEEEIRYCVDNEWVRTTDDFLWRRSKLRLHIDTKTHDNLTMAIDRYVQEIIK